MHLLMIAGSYPPMKCGVGSYTRRLVRELAEFENMRITVLTDERAKEGADSVDIEVLPVIRGWSIRELRRVAGLVKAIDPDLVHIQYPTQAFSGRLMPRFIPALLRVLGKRCLQTWHEPLRGWYELPLLLNLQVLISVREHLFTGLPAYLRRAIPKRRFVWIPGASLLPEITADSDEIKQIRQRYVERGELLLVYYGFLAPLKGVESLFEILERVPAKLVMACDFSDNDSYHQSLREKIYRSGLESSICITGYLPDERLVEIIAAADAVVLPFREGAGPWNTSIDGALAQGVLVVSTSARFSGYNRDDNIYFARPGDVDAMASAIRTHAGHRKPPRSVSTEWKNIARKHVQIYQQVVGA